jgi:hypothetical protein
MGGGARDQSLCYGSAISVLSYQNNTRRERDSWVSNVWNRIEYALTGWFLEGLLFHNVWLFPNHSNGTPYSLSLLYSRAGWSRFESRQELWVVLFTTASRPTLGPAQPPIPYVPGALFLGVKRPGLEADYSPSSAEVKDAWSYTSTLPIRLNGVVLSSTGTILLISLFVYYNYCGCSSTSPAFLSQAKQYLLSQCLCLQHNENSAWTLWYMSWLLVDVMAFHCLTIEIALNSLDLNLCVCVCNELHLALVTIQREII